MNEDAKRENIAEACETVAGEIVAAGWSVRENFVSPEQVAELRIQLEAWWREGELRKAGIGRGESFQVREEIRRDYVRWLDLSVGGRYSAFLESHFEPLRLAVNRAMYLGVYEYEGHVTVYPPGAFYRRHVDQFRDAAHRKISLVLYLNDPDWSASDGGELRLFLPKADANSDTTEDIVDVIPRGGTLVAFLSHEIAHEVLPVRRERFSLTGWFRTRS